MEVKIQIKDDQGKVYQGTLVLNKQKQNKAKNKREVKQVQRSTKVRPSQVIDQGLYYKKFFQSHKSLSDVEKKLNALGYNYKKGSILMALKRAEYLNKSGKRGNYMFVQKYPPKEWLWK